MERRAHIIKKNAKNEMPRHVIFFDTETAEKPLAEETELILKVGQACYKDLQQDKEIWREFKKRSEFWDFVFSKIQPRAKLYLVAHNVSFDFRVLAGFKFLKDNDFSIQKIIYSGGTNIWEFKKGNRTICVLDNLNFFKCSLQTLGASIGLEKMEVDFEEVTIDKLSVYCRRDVEIIVKAWDMLLEFLEINDLGNFAKTIAGQAFNAYRHRFMKKEIYIHTWEKAIACERESYHGGRTEAFFIGELPKQKYYMLDVNSMYPSLMRNNKYPRKLLHQLPSWSLNALKNNLKKYAIISKVLISTETPVFPVYQNGKLIFPIGTFETVLTTRELEHAVKNNYIRSVGETYIYEKDILFKDYVDFFYKKRLEYKNDNNEAFAYICKLFLNSLYGKFGQRNEVYEKTGENSALTDGIFQFFDVDTNKTVKERYISGNIERMIGTKEGYNSMVSIASHITADARMKLWHIIEIAGRENVFYCDTDSIFTNFSGYLRCQKYIGQELGQLSIKETTEHLKIYGCKDYEFKNRVVIKGIRKDAQKITPTKFKQVKFEGLAGSLRNNRINKMIISKIFKNLKREYDKGIVLENGIVKPHRLGHKFAIKI